jgi:hypothetical protein
VNCSEARERAPELALGVLGGAERAEVLLHVNGCGRCQAHVAELTEAADALPLVALEAEPSPGFEGRVMAAIDAPKRTTRRRWVAVVAAAAAAAAIISITIVRVIDAGNSRTTTPRTAAAPIAAQMVGGAAGKSAGWVAIVDGRTVTVAVDYGVPAGKYRIKLQSAHGADSMIGAMEIDETGRGFWAGRTDEPIAGATTISLVDSQGNTACHGTVGTDQ